MTTNTIVAALNALQALLNWLTSRGMTRDRVIALIETANAEGRDVTSDEVRTELNRTDAILDEIDGELP